MVSYLTPPVEINLLIKMLNHIVQQISEQTKVFIASLQAHWENTVGYIPRSNLIFDI